MKQFRHILGLFSHDMGIDLGTANTLVAVRGKGIVLREPSVVAVDTESGAVKAVGLEAKRMIGRTPAHIVAVRPLKDGVIADFDMTKEMLLYFVRKVHKRQFLYAPRVVVGIPAASPRWRSARSTTVLARLARARRGSSRSRWPRPLAPVCRSGSRSAA